VSSISTPEVNYEVWNQALRRSRRRGKILVIYQAGSLSHAELCKKDKLKEFYFLGGDKDPVRCVSGMELSGLIMEPGTVFNRDQMGYILGRMKAPDDEWIFILDENQWLATASYLQEAQEILNNKERIAKFMKDIDIALDRGEYLKRCWGYEKWQQ